MTTDIADILVRHDRAEPAFGPNAVSICGCGNDWPCDAYRAATEAQRLVAALAAISAYHAQTSGSGYTAHGWGGMESVCEVCGTADEYGQEWPCHTRQLAAAALKEKP